MCRFTGTGRCEPDTACGTKLLWNNYMIKEHGVCKSSDFQLFRRNNFMKSSLCTKGGIRGEQNWLMGQLVEKVVLCRVTAPPAAPQVACFIYVCKKEVSFLTSGQAVAGVGGMPGCLREDPRAALVSWGSVGTVLLFLQLLHLMLQSELPEMGPRMGRQKAVGKEGKNMLVEG